MGKVKTEMVYECKYCGWKTDSVYDMVVYHYTGNHLKEFVDDLIVKKILRLKE